jgi:thymidylate kinase
MSELSHSSRVHMHPSLQILTEHREETRELDHFSQTLFLYLDGFGVRYCVLKALRETDDAPLIARELAVHPEDRGKLLAALRSLEDKDYFVVQEQITVIPGVRRYCFACLLAPLPTFHDLTVLSGPPVSRFLPSTKEIIERRKKRETTWAAAPADEFRYRLFKDCLQGTESGTDEQRLQQLIGELGLEEANRVAQDLFENRWQSPVDKTYASLSTARSLNELRRRLWWKYLCRDPLVLLKYAVKAWWGVSGRWFRPNGLLVAILGPDGVGKSSFSAKLLEMFQPVFSRGRVLQWRPQVIKPRPDKNPLVFVSPHSKPAHGKTESVLRLLAVLVDYWVGQVVLIKPSLAQSSLLLYDRNFHDILVDTKRYRYGGPRWLLHLAKRMVPHSELVFLTLEADPETILQRKQEVSPEEVGRQCTAYRKLAQELPESHLIRTDRDLEQSVAEGSRILVSYLNRRFKKRNRLSFPFVEPPKKTEKQGSTCAGQLPA